MRPRSARFDAQTRQSRTITTTVDVLYGGSVVVEGLAVVDGGWETDRSKAVRGQVDLVLAEPELVPAPTGVLTPHGYEMRVRHGVVYAPGDEELLDIGVFPIQQSAFEGISLQASITAFDRSQLVIDALFEDDYEIADGTNYATAIQLMILDGVPSTTFSFPTTSFTTPALVWPMGSDRWAAARNMAASCGWEIYFDSLGRCAARSEPSITTVSSSWTVDEGADGVLIGASLDLDRGPAFNKVVATGENTSLAEVYRGDALDDDPTSPTYYYGPFGRKPKFISSPLFASDLQCAIGARAELDRCRGIARSLQLTSVPHPALEDGDGITVYHTGLGIDQLHLLDRVKGSFRTGAMELTTRTVQ